MCTCIASDIVLVEIEHMLDTRADLYLLYKVLEFPLAIVFSTYPPLPTLISSFPMDQLHVTPKKINYCRLHMTSYPDYYSLAPLGLLPLISMGKYIKINRFHGSKYKRYVYVLLPEQQDTKILCAFKRTSI